MDSENVYTVCGPAQCHLVVITTSCFQIFPSHPLHRDMFPKMNTNQKGVSTQDGSRCLAGFQLSEMVVK